MPVFVDTLAWRPVPSSTQLLEGAWRLEAEHSLSFCDATILAAANESGCERILSEDLTDGAVYGGVELVNPFLHDPV